MFSLKKLFLVAWVVCIFVVGTLLLHFQRSLPPAAEGDDETSPGEDEENILQQATPKGNYFYLKFNHR